MHHPTHHAFLLLTICAVALPADASGDPSPAPTLRQAFSDDFLIGAAFNTAQIDGRNAHGGDVAARQFSTLTAENDMKWQSLHPEPDVYQFKAADSYAEFAAKHSMTN